MTHPIQHAPLFDDNPAAIDLLGFGAVADAVVRVLVSDGLDPVTVGVQGGWGGGKSTLLNLVDERLKAAHPDTLVVRVDPWEFEDSQDVRGTLIALVLNALHERVASSELTIPEYRRTQIAKHLTRLRTRIAWGRATKVLVSGAVSLIPGGGALSLLGDLVEALMPPPPEAKDADEDLSAPTTMAGFRDDFKALLGSDLGIKKVAVLVDDLDRCLPAAAVATLEAIKLFLSVPKMAFVLAADEDLVRASIDKHLGGLANGEFAKRYTEKIVQLPISLPQLSSHDTEAFVALLFAASVLPADDLQVLLGTTRERRRAGNAPYVHGDESLALRSEDLTLAATVAAGFAADTYLTPRAVKRFLNNLAVREQLARDGGAELPLGVLVRLYLLELRHLPEFKVLADLQPEHREELLRRWEAWGRQDSDAQCPEGIGEATRAWAASEPSLVDTADEISRYLTVAATLRTDVRVSGPLDASQRERLQRLLSASEADRRAGVLEVLDLAPAQQAQLAAELGEQLGRVTDIEGALDSLGRLARSAPVLVPQIADQLTRPTALRRIEPQHVPLLQELNDVLVALRDTEGIKPRVKTAALEFLT